MRGYLVCLVLLVILFSCDEPENISWDSIPALTTGIPFADATATHEADTFALVLPAHAFVYGYADQHTADVIVRVVGPDWNTLTTIDRSARGPESFSFTTKDPGNYSLIITPFEEATGEYAIVMSGVEPVATSPEDKVEQLVRAHLVDPLTDPGFSIAVEQDGKLVLAKGYGMANLEYDIPITSETIFHVASVSKQFTAFAIALLIDQGKVSLDDDIRQFFPELGDFGATITIDHLVHHTSGLRDQWNLLAMAGWRLDDVITTKQILQLISRQRELNFPPGEEMLYCNTGFTLMAEIVSRVTGQSFAEWTMENIFEPLEMSNTFFYDDHERIVPNRAYSYSRSRDQSGFRKRVLSYANAGATSLFTTAPDLCKWTANFRTLKVGNEAVMQLMEQRFVLNNGDTISYAFGQGTGVHGGLTRWSHGGADAGYRSYLLRFPHEAFSVAVTGNYGQLHTSSIAYDIADIYLSDRYLPETNKPLPGDDPDRPSPESDFDPSSVDLESYAGTYYSDELLTAYKLIVHRDTLKAVHQRHDTLMLQAIAPDTFRTDSWFLRNLYFDEKGSMKVSSGRVRNVRFRKLGEELM